MSTSVPQLTPSQLNYAESSQWQEILKQALADLRVAIPAIVQSFDPVEQTVTVQIALREVVRTDSGPQNVAIQPIYKVPVVLPRAGGFCLTMPLTAGDEGMLVFCDMCIDLWWVRGGTQNQLERRRHDITDCGFYPGMWSQPRVLAHYSANSAQLRSDDDTVVIDVALAGITLTAPKVLIQSSGDVDISASGNVNISGAQIVAASSGANTKLDGKVFLTHEHTGVQTGGGTSGPVA
jgi:hypothetical protein